MVIRLTLILVLAAVALPLVVTAQEERDPRELIEAYRIWKLSEVLDLSEEEMPLFFAGIRKMDETERDYRRKEYGALKNMEDLLQGEDTSAEELEDALHKLKDIRLRRVEELARIREETLDILSVRQKCEFMVFEMRFRGKIRDMIKRVKGLDRLKRSEGGDFRERGRFDEDPGRPGE
jgi:hypothetical protein